MKKRKFFGSMLTFALASVFVLSSCTNKTKQEETREDINEEVIELKQDAQENMHDFKNYSYTQKEKFVKDANEELDKMNREIDKLKAELDSAGDQISAETRASYEKGIADMEKVRDDFKKNVEKAQNSTEDTWEQTKKDVGDTYDKTKNSIKEGWNEAKHSVNKGIDKVKDKLD